jgi:hypothetical protein
VSKVLIKLLELIFRYFEWFARRKTTQLDGFTINLSTCLTSLFNKGLQKLIATLSIVIQRECVFSEEPTKKVSEKPLSLS